MSCRLAVQPTGQRVQQRALPGGNILAPTGYLAAVKRLSRISLVVGFLALQLTSLAGGPGCSIPAGGTSSSGATATMAGMPGMPDTPASTSSRHSARTDGAGTDDSDTQQSAPQTPCVTMTVCVFASAPAVVEAPVETLQDVSDVMPPQNVLAPAAILSAPDTPPPRV